MGKLQTYMLLCRSISWYLTDNNASFMNMFLENTVNMFLSSYFKEHISRACSLKYICLVACLLDLDSHQLLLQFHREFLPLFGGGRSRVPYISIVSDACRHLGETTNIPLAIFFFGYSILKINLEIIRIAGHLILLTMNV